MNIISLHPPQSDQQRAEILFQGDIIIYRNVAAMQSLIAYADDLLQQELRGVFPPQVQQHFSPEEFLQRTGCVQTVFRKSTKAKALFFAVLAECGVDVSQTFYDHFPMRIVPYDNTHNGAHRAFVGHHRDTWGANIHSQINWWAPLYELEAERTIALYPDYWHQPIANNTETWRFEDYLAQRQLAETERQSAYPSAPSPTETVDESGVVKVVLQPGDVLSFSSAHLHASVPNTTRQTRFSVEMRTINPSDIQAGRQAPNVDNFGSPAMYDWFKGIESKRSLVKVMAEVMAEKMTEVKAEKMSERMSGKQG